MVDEGSQVNDVKEGWTKCQAKCSVVSGSRSPCSVQRAVCKLRTLNSTPVSVESADPFTLRDNELRASLSVRIIGAAEKNAD